MEIKTGYICFVNFFFLVLLNLVVDLLESQGEWSCYCYLQLYYHLQGAWWSNDQEG